MGLGQLGSLLKGKNIPQTSAGKKRNFCLNCMKWLHSPNNCFPLPFTMLIRSWQRSFMRFERWYFTVERTQASHEYTLHKNTEANKNKQATPLPGEKIKQTPYEQRQTDLPWMLTQWLIGKSSAFLSLSVMLWKTDIIIYSAPVISFQNYSMWEEHHSRPESGSPMCSSFPSCVHRRPWN